MNLGEVRSEAYDEALFNGVRVYGDTMVLEVVANTKSASCECVDGFSWATRPLGAEKVTLKFFDFKFGETSIIGETQFM